MSSNPPSFSGFSQPVPAQPTAPPPAIAVVKEERRREMVFKVNGQTLTAVREAHIDMNGNHGPMAEVSIKIMADPTKIVTSEGQMDISTYGFDSLGIPPVMKKLQGLSDEVNKLAHDIERISHRDCELKIAGEHTAITSTEGILWAYIVGRIDERQLTQSIGMGMDNLNVIELIQFLKSLVQQYRDILGDALSTVPKQ